MLGTTMDVPLLLSRLIDYAAEHHGRTEVVARRASGEVERETWAGMQARSKRLAKALSRDGLKVDDCVASLAWNTINHLELFYAALGSGIGLHTVNPRLAPEDLRYMIEMVDDKVVFVDPDTLFLAEAVAPLVPGVLRWIYMDEGRPPPASTIENLVTRSELLVGVDEDFEWPAFDERQAATICFTSGTTGRPKGVVYSHRGVTLGAMNMSMSDMYAHARPGELECAMPLAPIFHANGWMMPFTAPMNGHKLVLPGRNLAPAAMAELIRAEKVTIAGAVPTVWQDLVEVLIEGGLKVPSLRTGLVAGTRPSKALLEKMAKLGIEARQTWGMTEIPGAARASPPPGSADLDGEDRVKLQRERQGRVSFQAQLKIVDDEGHDLHPDGVAAGRLMVRGPSVAGRYLGDAPSQTVDWLDTGDIAKIYPDGTLEIVDRAKDVIKSGGEWISTLELEAAALTHPAIHRAAVISMPHPRWQERPLLLCTVNPGHAVTETEILAHMAPSVAKWWLPDEVRFIAEMPLTGTGKIDKVAVRREYAQRSAQFVN